MKTIHQLPPSIVSKIAAGEVIEKPAFAVKELIENSIDAGATHIQIHLEEGGLRKMLVIDNGEGMSEEDLGDCYKLHTTSKINPNQEDLSSIYTMGFRGEALSSIAAISRLTIKSRQKGKNSGFKMVVENNNPISFLPTGIPEGTQIEVEDIYQKVPARRKFVDSPQKEYQQILGWVIRFALAYPERRFSLTHNKKQIFEAPTQNLDDRLRLLLKWDFDLLPVEFEDTYVKIQGFISKAENQTFSASKQFIFVNHRPVDDKIITAAIREAYGNSIDSRKNPCFVVFLTIPFEFVDVNVHPRKEQIAFLNSQLVFDQTQKAILTTLQNFSPVFHLSKYSSITKSFAGETLRQNSDLFTFEKEPEIKNVLQLHNLYIIFQSRDGFFVIDQHAAHEKILYEQLKNDFLVKKQKKLKLTRPINLKLSISDLDVVNNSKKVLSELGFEINQKGNLAAIPELLKDRNIKEIVDEIIAQLSQNLRVSVDTKSDEMLKFLACRSAIKRGDHLSDEKAISLINMLFKTENYNFCPHGRPTVVEYPLLELNKKFRRQD